MGEIFYAADFKVSLVNTTFVKTKIDFKKTANKDRVGVWRLLIYRESRLIDDRYFEIV